MHKVLKSLGCDYIYQDTPIDLKNTTKAAQKLTDNMTPLAQAGHPAYNCKNLEELKNAMLNFSGCTLKQTALNTVFADGNPSDAQVMLVGEAPGADEDEQGLPFVGQSGQLLNKIFASIGLTRDKLYIANIVPWRPPGNRTPSTDEIAICQPFIEQHIALIKPKILVLLGGVSTKTLLKTNSGITSLRGKFNEYVTCDNVKIPCIATYHPAYLLRSPGQKAQVWHDALRLKIKLESLNSINL